jgi:uncharacterized LabA/DUF88 family protein
MKTTEFEGATQRLAVLIDADNAQPMVIEALMAEVARFGEATIRRIYGDFTSSRSSHWKQILNRFAINPVQQFAYTTGKNATDSRLIIDAMDLLHQGNVSGFCLVSSDSDFTGLASRIREEGLLVYGFGEQKTPEAFRNACHQFVFTENLRPVADTPKTKKARPKESQESKKRAANPKQESVKQDLPAALLKEAVENAGDDMGWAHLGALGSYLRKLKPDFDSRSFGFKKLTDLFMAMPEHFEFEDRATPDSPTKIIYIRLREGK